MVRSFAAALGMTLLALLCACASATGLRPGPDGTPPSGGLTMLYSQKPEAILPQRGGGALPASLPRRL